MSSIQNHLCGSPHNNSSRVNIEDLHCALDFLESMEDRTPSHYEKENPYHRDELALMELRSVVYNYSGCRSNEARELCAAYFADAKNNQTIGHAEGVCKDFCAMVVRKADQAVIDELLRSDNLQKMKAIGARCRPRADAWRDICRKIRIPEEFSEEDDKTSLSCTQTQIDEELPAGVIGRKEFMTKKYKKSVTSVGETVRHSRKEKAWFAFTVVFLAALLLGSIILSARSSRQSREFEYQCTHANPVGVVVSKEIQHRKGYRFYVVLEHETTTESGDKTTITQRVLVHPDIYYNTEIGDTFIATSYAKHQGLQYEGLE